MPAHRQLSIGPFPLQRSEPEHSEPESVLPLSEKDQLWAELGKCMVFVCYDLGLSLKEFAARLKRDDSQVKRQMEGKERPQIEAVFAVPEFRQALVIALARITPGMDVTTEIRAKRSA